MEKQTEYLSSNEKKKCAQERQRERDVDRAFEYGRKQIIQSCIVDQDSDVFFLNSKGSSFSK